MSSGIIMNHKQSDASFNFLFEDINASSIDDKKSAKYEFNSFVYHNT